MLSAASDSVMLCATVNAVTIDRQLPDRAAEQQQADEKQQVVGADQNVVDAGRQNLRDDGERALPGAGEVLEPRAAAVENRLGQRVAFVDVEERLVLRIVRETSPRSIATVPGVAADAIADVQPHRLPVRQRLRAPTTAASARAPSAATVRRAREQLRRSPPTAARRPPDRAAARPARCSDRARGRRCARRRVPSIASGCRRRST